MSTKELREKYAASNGKTAINRAIRAELPGGAEALDVLERLHYRVQETRGQETGSCDATFALDQVRLVVAAMESEIRRRYGLPEAP